MPICYVRLNHLQIYHFSSKYYDEERANNNWNHNGDQKDHFPNCNEDCKWHFAESVAINLATRTWNLLAHSFSLLFEGEELKRNPNERIVNGGSGSFNNTQKNFREIPTFRDILSLTTNLENVLNLNLGGIQHKQSSHRRRKRSTTTDEVVILCS